MKIAVISGKGGSGKSSISAAFVALSSRVVAVDCDVDASNLPLLFHHQVKKVENFVSGEEVVIDADKCVGCGTCVSHCGFSALQMTEGRKVVANSLLCEGCGFCVKICPQKCIRLKDMDRSQIYTSSFPKGVLVHGDLYPGDDNSGKMIARIRTVADEEMKSGNYELQILDGPPGISCPVLSTITGMNRIVIVSEPTLSGISDLQRAYRVASSYCKDVRVVINKCDVNENNRQDILSLCKELNVPVIAELPMDRNFVKAQLACESIVTYAPDSIGARALSEAYRNIIS